MTDILLIQAPLDIRGDFNKELISTRVFPPLGLLSIATFIKKTSSLANEMNVRVLDGDIEDSNVLYEQVKKSRIVGLSVNILNYENSLEIAMQAKEYGATVVLGGPYATSCWESILKNRKFIDYVVVHEGEVPFKMLIENRNIPDIPNIAFRNGNNVVKTRYYENDLSKLPIIDRSFIDLNKYFTHPKSAIWRASLQLPFMRQVHIYSQKGCLWRDMSGGCIYCARIVPRHRTRPINKIWEEIKVLKEKFDIDCVWDASDDILCDTNWFKEFVGLKPHDINTNMVVYGRANEISDETVDLLRKVNCCEIFIGFETNNNNLLANARKGCSVNDNIKAANILNKAGVRLFGSFVLGLPGETEKSLKNTLEFIKKLILENGNIHRLTAWPLIPMPGSTAFQMLLNKENKYMYSDILEIDQLINDWLLHFTKINIDMIYSTLREIEQLNLLVDKGLHVDSPLTWQN